MLRVSVTDGLVDAGSPAAHGKHGPAPDARATKILHVITALNFGGAETMLAKLLEQEIAAEIPSKPSVLSIMTPGPMGDRIRRAGVPLATLGVRGVGSIRRGLAQMLTSVRESGADLVVGWMYHGQLAATLAAAMQRPRAPVIWNVRHSVDDLRQEKRSTQAVLRLAAWLSKRPSAIIYNSHAAAAQYRKIGYCPEREIVIPNGFDCELFKPNPKARSRLLETFGIDGRAVLVGMVARSHPMKDPETLVRAVLHAREAGTDVHLVIAGAEMHRPTAEVSRLVAELPADRVTLSDHRPDMKDLLPGFDIIALPSAWGEGFPNIVGEAMACGVPCVVTDVGDSGFVVGDTGLVVPPRDPVAFGKALQHLANLGEVGRSELGRAARGRIVDHFSLDRVTTQYHRLFEAVREDWQEGRGTGRRKSDPAGGLGGTRAAFTRLQSALLAERGGNVGHSLGAH
jgi:glycosyltransferase involved in cell wall biosynthesis